MTKYLKLSEVRNFLPFKKEEFTGKIGLSLIGVSLVIIFLILTLFGMYTREKRLNALVSDGFLLTNIVAGYSQTGLEREEADRILKIVSVMGSKRGLLYGMITDREGRTIAHTDVSSIGNVLSDPIALKAVSSNNPLKQVYKDPDTKYTIYDFTHPLYINGEKAGVVRLGFSLDA